MFLSDFDYVLPPELIAQEPLEPRDSSRLLFCSQTGSTYRHQGLQFRNLVELLTPNDVLVLNDSKVLPVRLLGVKKDSGGAVELLLLNSNAKNTYRAILKLSARVRPGLLLYFEPGLTAEVLSTHEERTQNEGEVLVRFSGEALQAQTLESWLDQYGNIPLPTYIETSLNRQKQKQRYQTVYAQHQGSSAAPTAGMHFTPELLSALQSKSVQVEKITLHVGLGTFRPIKVENLDEHRMHEEEFEISANTAARILAAKKSGKRIVAVGTTVVRCLESWMAQAGDQTPQPGHYKTSLFIQPGFEFRAVDDMITNFHLPKSSLLVLVSALMGTENAKAAYAHAIANRFRFFSFGDSMFVRRQVFQEL